MKGHERLKDIHETVFEEKIGYSFKDKGLLTKAMTHSSYANDMGSSRRECNERLEFLGDAILEAVVSYRLFRLFPEDMEGTLSRKRAALVCERSLAIWAREIGIEEHILLGKSLRSCGGGANDAVLSDCFEALIGAIFTDGGQEAAGDFIYRTVLSEPLRNLDLKDAKTAFQELVQKYTKGRIEYRVVQELGPDHDRTFVVELSVGDKTFKRGKGHSKQAAGQEAAKESFKDAENYFKGTVE